jgi:hypothetical protein
MLIQAAWRGHKARFEYAAALSRIIRLQACVRGWLARNHAEELRGAVVVIQVSEVQVNQGYYDDAGWLT